MRLPSLKFLKTFEVAAALIEKFGGDSLLEMKARYQQFQELAKAR